MTIVLKQGTTRLRWRVLVGTAGLDPSRPTRPLSWHLITCDNTSSAESHCEEGQRLLISMADPDGHCLLNGECPRCAQQAEQEQQR